MRPGGFGPSQRMLADLGSTEADELVALWPGPGHPAAPALTSGVRSGRTEEAEAARARSRKAAGIAAAWGHRYTAPGCRTTAQACPTAAPRSAPTSGSPARAPCRGRPTAMARRALRRPRTAPHLGQPQRNSQGRDHRHPHPGTARRGPTAHLNRAARPRHRGRIHRPGRGDRPAAPIRPASGALRRRPPRYRHHQSRGPPPGDAAPPGRVGKTFHRYHAHLGTITLTVTLD
jgi:hypothetical protein